LKAPGIISPAEPESVSVDPALKKTRKKLELALHRLQRGTPRKVKKGVKITPASVALEAGVERSTLYRYHEPVLDQIRSATNKKLSTRLADKQATLTELRQKLKDHVKLSEEEQEKVELQARIIHRLEHRIKELEAMLRVRDERILKLQKQVNSPTIRRVALNRISPNQRPKDDPCAPDKRS